MKVLSKLGRCSHVDWYLLFMAAYWLIVIRLGLKLFSFQKLYQNISQVGHPHWQPSPQHSASLRKIVWAVNVISRYMPGRVKCLAKALTTQVIGNQHGYRLDLCVGVAKEGDQLEAHAWVLYQDRIVIGALPNLNRFTPIFWAPGGSLSRCYLAVR
jgi:hypothetical protein